MGDIHETVSECVLWLMRPWGIQTSVLCTHGTIQNNDAHLVWIQKAPCPESEGNDQPNTKTTPMFKKNKKKRDETIPEMPILF